MLHSSQSSTASRIAKLPPNQRQAAINSLSEAEALQLLFQWKDFWARSNQLAPAGKWLVWLILAGRGFGKTRMGAEWIRERVDSGVAKRIALVGRTAADCRDVIVEGESGILAKSPPWTRPKYEPSKRRLTWPNGAIATLYSGDEPDVLRGPQHDTAWCDEVAAWRYADAWDQLQFGLRLGDDPRIVATTTPRPTKLIKSIVADANTITTRGSTFDNAGNLAPAFLEKLLAKYKGTRLGRQELYAEILDDAPGALWKRDRIDALRVDRKDVPKLHTIVVAIDPAITSGEFANETGIIVVGLGVNGHGYLLDDLSGRYSPDEWGRKAVQAYLDWHANRIVAEVNQGGDLVKANIKTVARDMKATVHVVTVHAARGKRTRAEPVAALYEQGSVHHVGSLPELEDQQCTWEPDVVEGDGPKKKIFRSDSPDRLDAAVWGLTDLMIIHNPTPNTAPKAAPRVRVGDGGRGEISGSYEGLG